MCDRVVVLSQGVIQADQATEDITDLETLFREKTAQ
jgi:ABC-type hemin transport system ATPase subunit